MAERRTGFELRGVCQRYSGREVLRSVSMEVRQGETLAVVGPSGSGKSTLLRLLCLLESPSAGELLFEGRPALAADLPLRRRMAMCFQQPALMDRSVRDNVLLGLQLRGRHNAHAADELIDRLGLSAVAHMNARRLSGGEAQRTALARAMAVQPDVLLLDEPTANLDPRNVMLIEQTVREAQARAPLTIVWVTHNLHQARRMAGRVAFVLDGQVVEVSDASAFFDLPRDSRSAAFVRGDMIW